MFSYLIKRMKGLHRMSQPQINTRVNDLAEMKAAIDKAISAAESAGVKPAAMVEYFTGCLNYARQRALHQAEQAGGATRMFDQHGHLIDHAGNVARARAIRDEQQCLADEAEYRADVERRAEAQAERDGYVR
jgi:hypothetical protein